MLLDCSFYRVTGVNEVAFFAIVTSYMRLTWQGVDQLGEHKCYRQFITYVDDLSEHTVYVRRRLLIPERANGRLHRDVKEATRTPRRAISSQRVNS